jgi:hypothetical protein
MCKLSAMPRHDPATPLPNPVHEAYAQQRVLGLGPTPAAAAAGLTDFRRIERHVTFKARLKELSAASAPDPTLTLQWLVTELKRNATGASAVGQYKNTLEATRQLAELYAKYPQLRGDVKAAGGGGRTTLTPEELADQRAAREARLSRREAYRAELGTVPVAHA